MSRSSPADAGGLAEHVRDLEKRVARLDLVFRNAVDIIVMMDASTGSIIRASDAVTSRLGYEPGQLVGTTFQSLLSEDEPSMGPGPDSMEGRILDGVFMEVSLVCSDGSKRKFDMTASLVESDSESIILVTLRDTEERKRYEHELRIRNSALDSSLSATTIVTPDWTISYANEALLRTWRLDGQTASLTGRRLDGLWKRDEKTDSLREAMLSDGQWTGEITCRRLDGEEFPALVMASGVLSDSSDRICMVFSFVDITERRKLESELTALSFVDSLTGLYNRRGLMTMGNELLKSARRDSESVAMLFVDLDCLKTVNDRYGHDEGDEVLRRVAAVIREALRERDLACRIGGDEFAVLLRKSSESGPQPVIQRLRDALDRCNRSSDGPCRISISVGYTEDDPARPDVIGTMLRGADRAMYSTKRDKKRALSNEELLERGGMSWAEETGREPAESREPGARPSGTATAPPRDAR